MTFLLLALLLPQDAGALIEKLRSDRVEERDDAERKLKEFGRSALPVLQRAEKDPDPEVAARARHLGRLIRGTDRLTPNFLKAFPKLEERLGSGQDHEWTEALIQSAASCLEPEDLDPLAARAIRGARSRDVRSAVLGIIRDKGLRSAIPEIAALLRNPDDQVRIAASVALRLLNAKEAVPQVLALLKHPQGGVRLRALDLLPRLEAAEAVPQITRLLVDPEGGVRGTAATALASLEGKAAVPKLLLVLKLDPAPWVRLQATRALNAVCERDAIPAFALLLEDPDASLRVEALHLLHSWNAKAFAPAIARRLTDPVANVRCQAVEVLFCLGCRDGTAEMMRLLADPDADVRANAAAALGGMRVKSAVPALLPLLADKDGGVCRTAAGSLAQLGAREAVPGLIQLLDDPDANTRSIAIRALAMLDARESTPKLAELLGRKDRAAERTELCLALGDLDGKEAIPTLTRIVKDDRDADAAFALGRLKARDSVPVLATLLGSRTLRERAAASVALANLGAEEWIPEILKQLDHPPSKEGCCCAEVVWALVNAGRKEAGPAALSMIRSALPQHRTWAAGMVGALGLREGIPTLAQLIETDDPSAPAAALGQLKAVDAAPALVRLLGAGGASSQTIADALVAMDARDQSPSLVGLLNGANDSARVAAASAVARFGSREGISVLLGEERNLWALNALARRNCWNAIAHQNISAWPRPMTMAGLLGQLESAKTKIEPTDSVDLWRLLALELPRGSGPKEVSALDVLRSLDRHGVDFILEPGKIRLVPRDEAVKYWRAWWDEESKK